MIKYVFKKVKVESKNKEKSLMFKEEGIKLFKENKYQQASKKFNEAIVRKFSRIT